MDSDPGSDPFELHAITRVAVDGRTAKRWASGQNSQVARQERLIQQQKATSLPSWRSLIGDSALARVGEYRTEEKKIKKSDFAHVSHAQRRLEVTLDLRYRLATSPFSAIFINTVPGILTDRGLRYHPSGDTRRNRVNKISELVISPISHQRPNRGNIGHFLSSFLCSVFPN